MIESDPEYREQGRTYWNDVSHEAAAFLEAACNVRYFGDRWKDTVHVKPIGKHFGNCGVAEYVIDEAHHDAESLERLKRMGLQPIDVQRVPRSGDWHGIGPEEIAEGHRRVIVNLDTLEYIDPVKFGQVPTLAGMVNLAPKGRRLMVCETVGGRKRKVNILNKVNVYKDPKTKKKWVYDYLVDVAGGLFVMLCHPERRGGGDIPANEGRDVCRLRRQSPRPACPEGIAVQGLR